ncbi:bifunctional metallophosphatase/5'-nucleotidase [Bacillus suaedaesalsae]|uniref:Bifunctional metallophosphatase/5'-nucleotidase n=1 Tax=Bacillus suaedaesalsae TaxID=2810349 RepID=A0ABS2DN08_9BACI|nr:bifunctional UDP-sugar hydrolase/5'-nucleotidase [Bacillus suaedaesalsae]MBM6618866.1 bifunctional metallophosphatase/5'-nucleotidase [Bacillus suaedaesalsae]
MKKVHLYHINDLHSHFHEWPKVAQFIKERRAQHKQNGEEMLLFDIGDHMDRVHPITEATLGKANVRLMNNLQYDYVTIGNNEGITLAHHELDGLYEEANFQVLVGNLLHTDGSEPKWVKKFTIHQTESGLKLGLIGLTVPFQKFYELLDWQVLNPFDELPKLIQEVKNQGADFIVLLSHLGISDDEKIAREIEGIDVILGAHTHHLLPDGLQVNQTILCGAGKFGMNVGHVELHLDSSGEISRLRPYVYSLEKTKKCNEAREFLEKEMNHANKILNKPVAHLTEPLHVEWFEPSPFPQILAEAIREWCEADIGMICSGLLLDSLKEGNVTLKDLHRVCPHPINPCLVLLEGDELKEIILHAATPEMEQLQMKGFGFRGKVIGKMIYDGVDIETETLEDGKQHVTTILINGEPINPKQEYRVATLDMFTFGSLFPEISHAPNKSYYLPEMLRDLLKWRLARS